VEDRDSAVSQHSSDEEVTVAFRRIFFAAEQCNTVVPGTFKYPVNPRLECLAASHLVVADMTLLIVKLIIIWPATELPAKRDVFDLLLCECALERSCIEVRDIARPWRAAYISDDFDAVTLEEAQKIFKGDV
jgi:hypothetical protein